MSVVTEKYANNGASTLNGAINNSVTSLTVASAATFPSSGNFRIIIDSEIIVVGSVAGNVFSNLTRGAENSTVASHLNAAAVTHILTAGSMVKNPRSMSAQGDMEYLDSTGAPASVAAPADGTYSIQWTGKVPTWVAAGGGGGAAPSGSILAYGGSVAPTGFLLCNGQAVSRATFNALFAVIGITYGSGDGSTTFNVPDLRQRFPLGKAASGTGNTLGSTGGAIDHTHSVPGLGIPLSGIQDIVTGGSNASQAGLGASHNDLFVEGGAAPYTYGDTLAPGTGLGAASHNHSGVTVGGTTGTNNAPYQVVNYIIAQ